MFFTEDNLLHSRGKYQRGHIDSRVGVHLELAPKPSTELVEMTFRRAELASNLTEALDALSRSTYDVAIVDLSLGEEDGRDVAKKIESLHPRTKVVFMTGFAHAASILEAMGSTSHLRMPFEIADVHREVLKALAQ